jgi:guanine deaminase
MTSTLLRGRLLSFNRAPLDLADTGSYFHDSDGGLLLADGLIVARGPYAEIKAQAPADTVEIDHRPHLIMPGFIDTHLHFPQMQVIASYAANLLEWLNTYTFPEECRFVESAHAERIATHFYDELIRHGTTTAVAYCSVHKASADAFFAEAMRRNMRMVGGKVMMDRNAPQGLLDTPQMGYDETRKPSSPNGTAGAATTSRSPRVSPSPRHHSRWRLPVHWRGSSLICTSRRICRKTTTRSNSRGELYP